MLTPAVRTVAGTSTVFTELAALPHARHLATTAVRCPGERRTVRVLEDDLLVGLVGLVVEAPLVSSMLHERTIGALFAADAQDAEVLLGTLRVFLEQGGSFNAASVKTFVRRNTMLYRIDKIEKLTGLSVQELSNQVL